MAKPLKAGRLTPGPRYKEQMNLEAHIVLSDVDNTIVSNESLGLPSLKVTQVFQEAGEKGCHPESCVTRSGETRQL